MDKLRVARVGNLVSHREPTHGKLREVHPAGTVLIDKNMNIPTFTRTPSTYGMKARAQKRNKSRVDVFTEALIKTGVGATRQLEMQDENGNFPE